jgi:hypothetical protein
VSTGRCSSRDEKRTIYPKRPPSYSSRSTQRESPLRASRTGCCPETDPALEPTNRLGQAANAERKQRMSRDELGSRIDAGRLLPCKPWTNEDADLQRQLPLRRRSFRFTSEASTSGRRCNGSIASAGAARSASHLRSSVEGRDQLSLYKFGDKDMNHFFCRTCGVSPFSGGLSAS